MRVMVRSECLSRWLLALAFGMSWATLFSFAGALGPEWLSSPFVKTYLAPGTAAILVAIYPFVRRPHLLFRLISALLALFAVWMTMDMMFLQIGSLFTSFVIILNWRQIYGQDGMKESVSTWFGKVTWEEHIGDEDGTRQFFF